MSKLKLIITAVLLLCINICSAQKVVTRYIDKFLPISRELSEKWGIPVSIILGVSIHESGTGTSINCRELKNYFGVKGKNHLKKRHSNYKHYANAEESFNDFCRILSTKKFYHRLKGNMDYNLWLHAMNQHHYAGAKEVWVQKVKAIIRKYKLNKYDKVSDTAPTQDESEEKSSN